MTKVRERLIEVDIRVCSRCKQTKPVSKFGSSGEKDNHYCLECENKWSKEYRIKHKDKISEQNRNRAIRLKFDVMSHYSGGSPSCKYCGITDIDVLSIDHIYGNGCKLRRLHHSYRGSGIYSWIKQHNYPDDFQVLCFNCNFKKGLEDKRKSRFNLQTV